MTLFILPMAYVTLDDARERYRRAVAPLKERLARAVKRVAQR